MAKIDLQIDVPDSELEQSDIALTDFIDLGLRLACTATDIPPDSYRVNIYMEEDS